jgi:hypothetical protein
MAKNNNRKIAGYPKNINNINIGMVFFAVMAIYIIISVFTYLKKEHIVAYQVMEGSLSSNNIYEAIALRTEEIVESDIAGHVNYFATEGGRVAVGNMVYTVDESGQLLDYLKSQGSEQAVLNDEDLAELRSQIVSFDSSFDPHDFHTVYDFKVSLDGTVQKLSNNNILNNIQTLNENSGALASINYRYASDTGIVVYSVDGYEDKTLQQMTRDDLNKDNYEKKQLMNVDVVVPGDPVYKLCTSEEWSIVIMENDPEKVKLLEDLEYVKVRFIKNQDESWGKVSTYTNPDGDTFVQLTFTNSMITFCRDRYLDVELITEDQVGLKIPVSSIVYKDFYIVPKVYLIKNNDNTSGVLRVRYDEQGNETSEFVAVSPYNETESSYYLDTDTLRAGDILVMTDSNSRFTVSRTDTLIGVYNINKGYADFRQINILYQNEEYAIVRSNTNYGLNVYDYIVLEAHTVDSAKKPSDAAEDEASVSESVDAEDGSEDASEADSENTSEENSEETPEDNSEDTTTESTEESSVESSEEQ